MAVEVVHTQLVLEKEFKVYGTKEEPLFMAVDVADWIENKNVSQMLNKIDEDEKALYTMYRADSSTHKQWFLTEDGIYEVLMQSRKPIAKQFKKEVKNILKQIRQTGGYIPIEKEDDEMTILSKALMIAQSTLEKKDILIEQQSKQLIEQQPKVESFEDLIESKGNIKLKDLAYQLNIDGLGRNELYEFLRYMNVFQKTNKNIPYQKYIDQKYFEVKLSSFYKPNGDLANCQLVFVTPLGIARVQKFVKEHLEQYRSVKLNKL
jgi:anti-repressor protein